MKPNQKSLITYLYIVDLLKAHIAAHFRRDPVTGKLIFIHDYDDKRHAAELHVKYEKGDRVKIDNPKSKHHGKEGTIQGYDSKWDDLWINVDGHRKTAFKPHHPEHLDPTKLPKDKANTPPPVTEKKKEPEKVPEKVEPQKKPEPKGKPSDYFNDPTKAYEVAPQEYRNIANACGIMPVDDASFKYMQDNIEKLRARAKWVEEDKSKVLDWVANIEQNTGMEASNGLKYMTEEAFMNPRPPQTPNEVLPHLLSKPASEWEAAGYSGSEIENIRESIKVDMGEARKCKPDDYAICAVNTIFSLIMVSAISPLSTTRVNRYIRDKGYTANTPISRMLKDDVFMEYVKGSTWDVGTDFLDVVEKDKVLNLFSKLSKGFDPQKVTLADTLGAMINADMGYSNSFKLELLGDPTISGAFERYKTAYSNEKDFFPTTGPHSEMFKHVAKYLIGGYYDISPPRGNTFLHLRGILGDGGARGTTDKYVQTKAAKLIDNSPIRDVVTTNLILADKMRNSSKKMRNTIIFNSELFKHAKPSEIGLKIIRKKGEDLMDNAEKIVAEYGKNKGKKMGGKKTHVMFKSVDQKTFQMIEKNIQDTWDHRAHGEIGYKIHGVYEVGGTGIHEEFQKIDKERNNTKLMYHGTDFAAASNIVKTGFLISKNAKAGRMMMDGVYVTPIASKSCQYLAEGFTRKIGVRGILFSNECSLGKASNVKRKSAIPGKIKSGIDSVHIMKNQKYDTGSTVQTIRNEEHAIFNPKAVMPKYWIDVELTDGRK